MESVEKKSNAQENLNTVLGSIGTAGAFGLLSGGGLNLFGNRPPVGDPPWSRDLKYERELTGKDAEIGQLKAQLYTDQKITELRQELQAGTAAQAVINAQQNSVLGILQTQMANLNSMVSPYIRQPVMAASEAALSAFKATSASTTASTGN